MLAAYSTYITLGTIIHARHQMSSLKSIMLQKFLIILSGNSFFLAYYSQNYAHNYDSPNYAHNLLTI